MRTSGVTTTACHNSGKKTTKNEGWSLGCGHHTITRIRNPPNTNANTSTNGQPKQHRNKHQRAAKTTQHESEKRRKREKEKKIKREKEKKRKREQPGGLGPQDLSIPNGEALEQMPQRRAESPIQPTEASKTQQCLFSLFPVKARAGAKPQRGPRKDGLSPQRGAYPGYHYRKCLTHRAESRATWRATSPIPGRTAAKF